MANTPDMPMPPPEAPRQRGMILIVTLLMLTILTVLGSGAVMRTAANLREGSAQRLTVAAFQLSEAGTIASVGLAAEMQGGFATYAAGKAGNTLSIDDLGSGMLQLQGPDGSFGQELAAIGAVDFGTKVYAPDLTSASAGFDADRFCFHTYRLVTTAQIGQDKATKAADVALDGQQAIAAQVTVGPLQCAP